MLSAQQRTDRARGIGGSDAAVIAGLSPWKTPVQLWQEKTGRVPEKDLSDDELVQWGHRLEDAIAEEWARRNGKRIRRVNRTIVDKELPWMLGNIDRDVVGEAAGLEAKNTSAWMASFWGDEESDDVPLFYLTQCAHYMRVWDVPKWYVAVLIGGNQLRSYVVERDEEIEKQLISLEMKFWACVLDDTPPPALTVQDLTRLHPNTKGAIEATEEIALKVMDYKMARADKKVLEDKMDALKLEIGTYMGDNGDLVDPIDSSLTLATFRANTVKRIDVTRLRADKPDIATEYTKATQERKFLPK